MDGDLGLGLRAPPAVLLMEAKGAAGALAGGGEEHAPLLCFRRAGGDEDGVTVGTTTARVVWPCGLGLGL